MTTLIMILLLGFTCVSLADAGEQIRVFDQKTGQPKGTIKESAPGRYDVYDSKWNRTGYGQERNGRIEFFDTKTGQRLFTVEPGRKGK